MTSRSRILLVTPNWRWDASPLPVDTLLVPITPPLEFGYMVTGLQDYADVAVADAYAGRMSEEDLSNRAAEFRPTAVVVTSAPSLLYWRCPPMTVTAPQRAIGAIRKASGAPVVLIGPHATATPEWALEQTGADWCYRGAFENELPKLLVENSYSASRYTASLTESTGQISVLAARDLPAGSFGWLDPDAGYEPHMWCVTEGERAASAGIRRGVTLETSRGCPWSCAYCAKGPVRDRFGRRPLDLVANELDQVVQVGADYVFFIDEIFNIPSPEYSQLLTLIRQSGVKFGFQGRPDLIDRRRASQLAAAGCVYAELGIDVVSDSVSAGIGRRQSLARARDGVEACQEYISVVRFNRLNVGTVDYRELLADAEEDWDYPADPAFPYPGAALGELVMAKYGYERFDWDFARRYSWWLRLEVALQRRMPELRDDDVRVLERAFLRLPDEVATTLVRALQPIVETPDVFHSLNKIIMRKGSGVRTRDTRS